MQKLTGGCLCGGVAFEIDGAVSPIEACHCSRCRRSSGSAFSAALLCATKSFRWVRGKSSITSFRLSSGFAHSFCPVCGSPTPDPRLDSKVKGIPAGCLREDPRVSVEWHAFVGSKADWFDIADDIEQAEEQIDHARGGRA